jgi:hypothetical protein
LTCRISSRIQDIENGWISGQLLSAIIIHNFARKKSKIVFTSCMERNVEQKTRPNLRYLASTGYLSDIRLAEYPAGWISGQISIRCIPNNYTACPDLMAKFWVGAPLTSRENRVSMTPKSQTKKSKQFTTYNN